MNIVSQTWQSGGIDRCVQKRVQLCKTAFYATPAVGKESNYLPEETDFNCFQVQAHVQQQEITAIITRLYRPQNTTKHTLLCVAYIHHNMINLRSKQCRCTLGKNPCNTGTRPPTPPLWAWSVTRVCGKRGTSKLADRRSTHVSPTLGDTEK